MKETLLQLSVTYTGSPFLKVTTQETNTFLLNQTYVGYPWIGYSTTTTFTPIISWFL